MIPEAVHRPPVIYLTAEENPRKSLRRPSVKALQPVIASNGVLCLPCCSEHQVVRRKERTGWFESIFRKRKRPIVHGVMGCGQKKLLVSVALPPAPVRVPSQRPLATSVASLTSVANDKDAMHRSPGICLTAEENPRKPQLRDSLMKCDLLSPQMGSLSSK
jgi:hypothetical protein